MGYLQNKMRVFSAIVSVAATLWSGSAAATFIASYSPQVVEDGNGNAVAVFLSQDNTGQFFVRGAVNSGSGWSSPVTLSSSSGSAFTPLIAADISAGKVVAVWGLSDNTSGINYLEAVEYPISGTWGSTATLTTSSEDASLADHRIRIAGNDMSVAYSAYVGTTLEVRSVTGTFNSSWDSSTQISD